MYKLKNFAEENDNVKVIDQKGPFKIIEYQTDKSVPFELAFPAYFANQMNIKKRQLICNTNINAITLQAGAMQFMVGEVNTTSGIKGVGDFFGKTIKGSITGETIAKPEYRGTGILITEPTYKHIMIVDLKDWNNSIVLDDGLFLACESNLKQTVTARSNVSSAVLGKEGLFNLTIKGEGLLCLEVPCPASELIEVNLQNDVIKIDGNMAIAWSSGLNFTVEKAGKSLIGSAASGEGFVNVYRGTGSVLLAPIEKSPVKTMAD